MRIYNMSGSNNSINYILFSMHSYRVPQNCFFFEPMLMNFLKAGNFGLVQVRCPLDIRWVSLNQWPLSEEMCQVSSCDYRRVTIGMNIFFERGPCIFASIFWVAMWSYHRPRTGLLFTAPQHSTTSCSVSSLSTGPAFGSNGIRPPAGNESTPSRNEDRMPRRSD